MWLLLALLAALVLPGRPTIVATEKCPEYAAERYLYLLEHCVPNLEFQPGMPGALATPWAPATEICVEEKPILERRCSDAVAGFEMNFVERLFNYGPYWLQVAKRLFR